MIWELVGVKVVGAGRLENHSGYSSPGPFDISICSVMTLLPCGSSFAFGIS